MPHPHPSRPHPNLPQRSFAAAITLLALVSLFAFPHPSFPPGQPVPKDLPARPILAFLNDLFLLLTSLALQFRRTAPRAATALAAYYTLFVLLILYVPWLLFHRSFLNFYSLAEQLTLTSAALILYATLHRTRPRAHSLTRVAQTTFALCAFIFGTAHFLYLNFTAPLVPIALPGSQTFWAYLTGLFFLAAGLALLTRIHAHLAATLLTAMLATFFFLVHLPLLIGDPHTPNNWTEAATNLAITAAAALLTTSLQLHPKNSLPFPSRL